MSRLKINALRNTAGSADSLVVNADGSVSSLGGKLSPFTGFKNRIINGDMRIDQRNNGASFTPTGQGQYSVDRWAAQAVQSSKFSLQQSTNAPAGFVNSLKATSLSAYSVLSTDYFGIYQPIEGLNIADLAWGTASAKTVTLSFQVYSSLTGTFGGSVYNATAGRSYPFSYTVSSANTWTQVSVVIPGDTTGTWLTTNGVGMYVVFSLGAGSSFSGTAGSWASSTYTAPTGAISVVGTNGATFHITGVQLEVGSTATSFDVRDFGRELIMCQRYYQSIPYPRTFMSVSGATSFYSSVYYLVSMRVAPTITLPSYSGNVVLNSSETPTTPGYQWNAANITVNSFSLRAGTANIGGIVEGTATATAEL